MSRGVRAKETLVPDSFFQRRRMSHCFKNNTNINPQTTDHGKEDIVHN